MRISIKQEQANVLLCVLCVILVVSVIGGNVLLNCVTRYNTASSQVRSWKESLDAAEAGGDVAYAEVRKTILDPTNSCIQPSSTTCSGWNYSGGAFTTSSITFGSDNLSTTSRIDPFYYDVNGSAWYRIRTKGTAPMTGLRRVTMDDRMGPGTRGDSLLRKIDFNYDHFIATYGPNGDNTGQSLVSIGQTPQISRRIELVSAPITPFEAAIKAGGIFYGLGSAAYIDSYRSSTGPYDASVHTNPSDPRYVDSQSGTVEINSAVATIMGSIYGNVYTNGGLITKKTTAIYGIIDNSVPFTLTPFYMPSTLSWPAVANPSSVGGNTTITPPSAGTASAPNYYLLSSFSNNGSLTVNAFVDPHTGVTQETYVAAHVTGDIGASTGQGATIITANHVHLNVYFDGNFGAKAANIQNGSGYAGNLQFYGISPTDPSVQQVINLNSGSGSTAGFAATFYAPSANFTINGGPDIIGAIVCKNFYANGNVHWHYDRQLDNQGAAVDYRIASYVEDTR